MKDNWIVMMCLLKNCFEPIVDLLGAEFVCFVTHLGSTRCVLLVEFQVKVDRGQHFTGSKSASDQISRSTAQLQSLPPFPPSNTCKNIHLRLLSCISLF